MVFSGLDRLDRALLWAQSVRRVVDRLPPIVHGPASFELEAKIGLGLGFARTHLVGTGSVQREVSSGTAIDEAARAEAELSPGEIGIAIGDPGATNRLAGTVRNSVLVLTETSSEHDRPDDDRPEEGRVVNPESGKNLTLTGLSPFIPAQVLERTEAFGVRYLDEHRPATVLFLGLASASMDDRTVADLTSAIRIVDQRGGTPITVGSGDKGTTLLAVFGAPRAEPKQKTQAIRAGLELVDELECRVGLATGTCFAGLVGSKRRWSYNLLGDPPNTAARLMTNADVGTVLACEATHRGTEAQFSLTPTQLLALKGKERPEKVRSVIGVRHEPSLRTTTLPLVGRSEETKLLSSSIERVLARSQSETVRIVGIAGIGKSRLLEEVGELAQGASFAMMTTDLSRSGRAAESYGAWLRPLRAGIGLEATAGPAEFMTLATERLTMDRRRVEILRDMSFGNLANNPTLSGVSFLDAAEVVDLVVADALAELCTEPTIILVDDAGDLDEASKRVLALLQRCVPNQRVLFVVASYPDDEPIAVPDQQLHLEELGPTDATQLLRIHLKARGDDINDDRLTHMVERVGGVPEVLRLVADLDDGAVRVADIPADAHSLVASRIDRAGFEARLPLAMASVLGRHFSRADFQGTFGDETPVGVLKHLLDARLIQAGDGDRLSFSSPMLRDVAYSLMSHGDRSTLHGKVGEFLESNSDSAVPRIEELAHHFQFTDRIDRQKIYFPAAARQARRAFANETAIEWYRRAESLPDLADRATLQAELAEVLEFNGSLTEALETYESIDDNVDVTARRMASSARVLQLLGRTSESQEAISAAVALVSEQDDPDLGEFVYEQASVRSTMAGQFEQAKADGVCQLRFARQIGDPQRIAAALSNVAAARSILGESEQALRELHDALGLLDRESSPHLANLIDVDVAMTMFDLGDAEGALEVLNRSSERAKEIGFRRVESLAHNNAALILSESSETLPLAETRVRLALQIELVLGDTLLLSASLGILGLCLLARKEREAAMESLVRVLRTARFMGVDSYRDRAYGLLADAYEELGDVDQAEACRSQAERTEDEVSDDEFEFVAPRTDPAESGLDDELVDLLRRADELIDKIPSG